MIKKFNNDLIRFVTGEMSANEKKIFEKNISANEKMQNELKQLVNLKTNLATLGNRRFNPSFTGNILRRISQTRSEKPQEVFFETLFRILKPVVAVALILLASLVFYFYASGNEMSHFDLTASQELTVEDAFDPITELIPE